MTPLVPWSKKENDAGSLRVSNGTQSADDLSGKSSIRCVFDEEVGPTKVTTPKDLNGSAPAGDAVSATRVFTERSPSTRSLISPDSATWRKKPMSVTNDARGHDNVSRHSLTSGNSTTSSPESKKKKRREMSGENGSDGHGRSGATTHSRGAMKQEEDKENKADPNLEVWTEAEKLMDVYIEEYGDIALVDIFRAAAEQEIMEMSPSNAALEGEFGSLLKEKKKYTFTYSDSSPFSDGGFRISQDKKNTSCLEVSIDSTSEEVVQRLRELNQMQGIVNNIEVSSHGGDYDDVASQYLEDDDDDEEQNKDDEDYF